MKIVYLITDVANIGGGLRDIFEQANRLHERGHQAEIWYENWSHGFLPFACRVPLRSWDGRPASESVDVLVLTDIYHLAVLRPKISELISAKRLFFFIQHDLRLLAELMGEDAMAGRLRETFLNFPKDCRVLSLSSWVKERLESQYKLSSILVRPGVDPVLFRPVDPLLRSGVPSALIFYNVQNWKGFDDACHAVNIVKKKIPSLRIIIVGAYMPKFTAAPEAKAFSMELMNSFPWPVIYFNHPEQEDLAAIYSSATVFISSSWYEGFGLPGLEAMACGVPVVTTDSGGVREYAVHEKNCLMVPPKDPEALAAAVKRVLDDKELSKKLVIRGLETAKEFDWNRMIDKLEAVLNG